jgi:ribosomal protein RSM22 (predicted rRNA methylase)
MRKRERPTSAGRRKEKPDSDTEKLSAMEQLEQDILNASRQTESGINHGVTFRDENDQYINFNPVGGYISNPDESLSSSIREDDVDTPFERTHPLTLANRFATFPSTLEVPLTESINGVITSTTAQYTQYALRLFGGHGLPLSTSTLSGSGGLDQQKPTPITAAHEQMRPSDAELFMAVLFPGVWAATTGVLVETRKRLGTAWAEELVRKAEADNLRILDAGGAGAGIVAVREVIAAEWERMHEESGAEGGKPTGVAEADGKLGGEGASPPLGQGVVLTGSDTLRHKASSILQNTSFVPRLPDYVHATDPNPKGKFDIIIAPYTLWQIREDFARKQHILNLWSLLKDDGGVLILLEKGVAQGFEAIAGARDMLLENRITTGPAANSDGNTTSERIDAPANSKSLKEPGMIIAPCTNHRGCPLYVQKGRVRGRNTVCKFTQRYHRPDYLQKIFTAHLKGGSGKNHEDVQFSYLSVMRGRDLRATTPVVNDEEETTSNAPADSAAAPADLPNQQQPQVIQNSTSTDAAFIGYEAHSPPSSTTTTTPQQPAPPHSLTLPRVIFPPLKRAGHVILDVCTPAGTLERWTVPRSFSRRAFRDARKSSWGDLWALGAKSRIQRYLKPVKGQMARKGVKRDALTSDAVMHGRGRREEEVFGEVGAEENGEVEETTEEDEIVARWAAGRKGKGGASGVGGEVGFEDEGGRRGQVRKGKVKGIREKRDKKGSGGKRRRAGEADEDD